MGNKSKMGKRGNKMHRLRPVVLTVASLALASTVAVGAFAGPAWAGKKATFTCTHIGGNSTTVTISGCGGNTGGSSVPLSVGTLATGGKLGWVNGQSTTVTLTPTAKKKEHGCPATTSSEFKIKGKVTADTTGSAPAGSKLKGTVCLNAGGTFSLIGAFTI